MLATQLSLVNPASCLFSSPSLSDVRLTLLEESSRIGGRLQEVEIDDHRFENGGSILHESNAYMKEFAQLLNLTTQDPSKLSSSVSLWDGAGFLLELPGSTLGDAWRVLMRYGLDFIRLSFAVSGIADQFVCIYTSQASGAVFETPEELLGSLGLANLTSDTFESWARPHVTNALVLDELAAAATRVNYGQGLDLNGFAGAIGLIPMTDGRLWSVVEGNSKVVEGLLENARVEVKTEHTVQVIERTSNQSASEKTAGDGVKEYTVSGTLATNGSEFAYTFDAVVIAAPLVLAGIEFRMPSETDSAPWEPQPAQEDSFQTTHATWVRGRLRPEAFGLDANATLPGTVLTTENETLPFTSIAAYAENATSGRRTYKVFSRSELDDARLEQLFDDVVLTDVRRTPWRAYPHYVPPEKFLPYRLYAGEDIIYSSALEQAASCMEVQAISARNAAALLAQRWNGPTAARDDKTADSAETRAHSEEL